MLADLLDSRNRSARVTANLEGGQLLGPRLAIVNPPLWEIGHVGWFQEYWCLRRKPSGEFGPSILAGADALYDSAKVAHDTRWSLPLPDIQATRGYLENVLERVRERLRREPENEDLGYFVRLATFHEDMHAEAFTYTRQTLGYEYRILNCRVLLPKTWFLKNRNFNWVRNPAIHSCSTTKNGRTR
jgi:iron(II)-dependent oxidoreductase